MKHIIAIIAIAAAMLPCVEVSAQDTLTREEILSLTTEQLSELPLEDLMKAVETLGLSSVDELFSLIMNKNVSSASKKEEDTFRSPLSTSVITREEIRALGCTTFEEALRLLPGVIVRQKSNGSYDVHLRGMDNIPDGNTLMYTENTNTLVMIDGRPVFNYVHGATLWESLPIGMADVERIEVVRGASGALYGANAVSGVINIITERVTPQTEGVIGTFAFGNKNTGTADLAMRKSIGEHWGISISGNIQYRERPTDKIFIIPATTTGSTIDYVDATGVLSGRTDEFREGKYVSVDEIGDLRIIDQDGRQSALTEPEAPASHMFPHPALSRKNYGINGGVYYTDAQREMQMTLMAGYQQSFMQGTALMADQFPTNGRTSKTGYVDMRIGVKGGLLQLNYFDGPQNLAEGVFGFKVRNQQFNGNLEYDITPTTGLSIRPGLSYQYTRIGDTDYNHYYAYRDDTNKTASFKSTDAEDWGVAKRKYSSYLNRDCGLSQLAGSLKIDYTVGEALRLIAAGRADKLRVPDKTFPSWLFSATYTINESNVVRAVYSRANRSGVLINTSSNYEWVRSELGEPDYMVFSGNEEADVMHADNLEIGYRLRPTRNMLIDLEAYYTRSSDYGALMSVNSQTTTSGSDLYTGIRNMDNFIDQQRAAGVDLSSAASALSNTAFTTDFTDFLRDFVNTVSYVQYQNLPYEVKQLGASVNLDWVVNSHLVAKINATVQQTRIDKYFTYQQSMAIREQIASCYTSLMSVMLDLYSHDKKYIAQTFQISDAEAWLAANPWFTGTDADLARLTDVNDEQFNPALYYNLVYKMQETIDDASGDMQFSIGDAKYTHAALENGHRHKYTPAFFGSMSLIYKPTNKLSIAPTAYFYGKQEAMTAYNASRKAEEIDGKFVLNLKIGYQPKENFEVFANAENLLGDARREFVYADKVGRRISLGIVLKR